MVVSVGRLDITDVHPWDRGQILYHEAMGEWYKHGPLDSMWI